MKLSPKQSPNGVSSSAGLNISLSQQSKIGGSIMHGTPVSSANMYPANARDGRYDASLLRQITPPSHPSGSLVKETGSITQGMMSRFDNVFVEREVEFTNECALCRYARSSERLVTFEFFSRILPATK